jgi:hypothetical protein
MSGSVHGTARDHRPNQEELKDQKQYEAAVAFIIQNEKEVIPWKKKTPISTSDLNQFIAIKFITKVYQAGQ